MRAVSVLIKWPIKRGMPERCISKPEQSAWVYPCVMGSSPLLMASKAKVFITQQLLRTASRTNLGPACGLQLLQRLEDPN